MMTDARRSMIDAARSGIFEAAEALVEYLSLRPSQNAEELVEELTNLFFGAQTPRCLYPTARLAPCEYVELMVTDFAAIPLEVSLANANPIVTLLKGEAGWN